MSVETRAWAEPTHRIVQAVAEKEGVDPVELDQPLFDVIDGDLLNALVASNENSADGPSLELRFEYLGYAVYVTAGDTVHVSRI